MNSYLYFRGWFRRLDAKTEASLAVLTLAILAAAVFGVFPSGSLLVVNAFLSGAIWIACLLILVLGGERVDRIASAGVALILGGLTTTIPSLFYSNETPVAWGATLSRMGLLILMLRWGYDIMRRWRLEHGGKRCEP